MRAVRKPAGLQEPYKRRCGDCGCEFLSRFPSTRRCDSCHIAMNRVTSRVLNGTCRKCGASFERGDAGQRLCPSCKQSGLQGKCCRCGDCFDRANARLRLCPSCRYGVPSGTCGKCGARFDRSNRRVRTCERCKLATVTGKASPCAACGKTFSRPQSRARYCDRCRIDRALASRRRYRARRAEQQRSYMATWRDANREHDRKTRRLWKEANREHVRQYKRRYEGRIRKSYRAKLVSTIRSRVATAIHAAKKQGRKISERGAMRYVGCSVEHLIAHLESLFVDGMSWANFGRGGWHIDHVFPIARADLADPVELRAVFHWKNCRPLWESENYAKWSKVTPRAKALFETIKRQIDSGLQQP
jgi:hypothetical protein